jgi:hypothetical protein
LQLQGSTWKGHKLRIAEARPDYKQRILIEASRSESAEAAAPQEEQQQHLEGTDTAGPSQLVYKIRAPNGQVLTLPYTGTGNKKSLFVPVKPCSMEDWLHKDVTTHRSSRYYTNTIWDQMVEAQANRPALDPTIFSSAVVPPVHMVRGNHQFTQAHHSEHGKQKSCKRFMFTQKSPYRNGSPMTSPVNHVTYSRA